MEQQKHNYNHDGLHSNSLHMHSCFSTGKNQPAQHLLIHFLTEVLICPCKIKHVWFAQSNHTLFNYPRVSSSQTGIVVDKKRKWSFVKNPDVGCVLTCLTFQSGLNSVSFSLIEAGFHDLYQELGNCTLWQIAVHLWGSDCPYFSGTGKIGCLCDKSQDWWLTTS